MEKAINSRLIIWVVVGVVVILIMYGLFLKLNRTRNHHNIQLLYYPTKCMTKIFKNSTHNESITHIVDKIADGKVQIRQIDLHSRAVLIYDVTGDSIKLVYATDVGNNEFEDDYITNLVPSREDIVIKAPIEVGTKWIDDDGGEYEIIKTNALIETNAGSFETVVVKYTNDDFTVKEFYAENIGLVKIVVNNFNEFTLEQITY